MDTARGDLVGGPKPEDYKVIDTVSEIAADLGTGRDWTRCPRRA